MNNTLSLVKSIVFSFVLLFPVGQTDAQLKVFVLVGQSNMQGHADVRTLEHLGMSKETKSMLDKILDERNEPKKYSDVIVAYQSSGGVKTGPLTVGFGANEKKIGPELMFGIRMREKLNEPILIIKAAWGGKSLNTDFRPPNAPPYTFSADAIEQFKKQGKDVDDILQKKKEATGVYYRKTIKHVRNTLQEINSLHPAYDPEQGYEISGIVWFQGWNDMVDRGTYPNRGGDDGYAEYGVLMGQLIRDMRTDLAAPQTPFVIGVMGVNGPTSDYGPQQMRYQRIHQNFRDAMAAPASNKEFQGNVFVVKTETCWDAELDRLVTKENEIRRTVTGLLKKNDWQMIARHLSSGDEVSAEQIELLKSKYGGKRGKGNLINAVIGKSLSAEELKIIRVGKSNAAFHYLGSAKIICKIGKAFADAIPTR